ncbi:hypothetical protein DFH09DRAFT_1406223 [Mycena vulgaris]|nr:hypothetical protein DFH09DRAFT_1406223 [Mycena vulgaris]
MYETKMQRGGRPRRRHQMNKEAGSKNGTNPRCGCLAWLERQKTLAIPATLAPRGSTSKWFTMANACIVASWGGGRSTGVRPPLRAKTGGCWYSLRCGSTVPARAGVGSGDDTICYLRSDSQQLWTDGSAAARTSEFFMRAWSLIRKLSVRALSHHQKRKNLPRGAQGRRKGLKASRGQPIPRNVSQGDSKGIVKLTRSSKAVRASDALGRPWTG